MTDLPKKDPFWYKNAIIYQLHVKAFFDSSNDGIGDFRGLTSKLDYLKSLGVNTLWLLPFYPSPMRDDGYDIADYRNVNPAYGTLDDFKTFIEEAHARDLRVITELVINHTSDQHPWFQRARLAPAGSAERDYYVWNDSNEKFPETRIIFTDTETSNWAWDATAGQYYWHRFFTHQPDLNFDNPRVLEEVIDIMYYWLDMGVDGLRLDAIPYLCVREGTLNENLPETHAVIKKIRAALDARYSDRVLLAEANQWPEDVQHYFGFDEKTGLGDECHMAFHFPLMPRLYMALAQEDRHPVTDIMDQTPSIPDNCQWAMFLRNHDELTLEMVSDRERDYLWGYYAADARARINVGIRRRLAPLMENDRRKVELLNGLLMSMPGTPIMYYGDEIGMGDNIYLGDRDGVRTPMQWSPDRNGGFSKADPAQLYLPAIMDPVFGFQSINVEAQSRLQSSFYHWMRKLIETRRSTAFGRGTLTFLKPKNRKVLAYLRECGEETILCIANLSRAAQPVELDLKTYKDRIPHEMLGGCDFPSIGELPYFLTLAPYGFYWFRLNPSPQEKMAQETPELATLVLPKGWESLNKGAAQLRIEKHLLPAFLRRQRWSSSSGEAVRIHAMLPFGETYRLALVQREGAQHFSAVVLGIAWETREHDPLPERLLTAIARVRQFNRVGVLYEAGNDSAFLKLLLERMQGYGDEPQQGTLVARCTKEISSGGEIVSMGADQSNSSARVGEQGVLKLLRKLHAGINPEEEMGRYLSEASPFSRTPHLLGSLQWEGVADAPVTLALLFEQVRNQGDGWTVTLDYLKKTVGEMVLKKTPVTAEQFAYYVALADTLGRRTAELHEALAQPTSDTAFNAEAISKSDLKLWHDETQKLVDQAGKLAELPKIRNAVSLPAKPRRQKMRVHGDYHLGQVLVTDNDFVILDFEGEPTRELAERRAKQVALKDVAGMLRSFHYAAATARRELGEAAQAALDVWQQTAGDAFIRGYETVRPLDDEDRQWLRFYLIEKAAYETIYESQHRPDWMEIPLAGLRRILEEKNDGRA